jgi:hypothetical protein
MHGSNCEMWMQIHDDLDNNVFSWSYFTMNGQITASDYMDIVGNQVHPLVQLLFPNNDAVFQDDILHTHTARSIHSWLEEHEDALQHLPWPAQLPYLNIIQALWSVLESKVGCRFHPVSSLRQVEDVFHDVW